MSTDSPHSDDTIRAAIAAGCVIAVLSFGFAASFGIFLAPMSQDLGWGREVFSLSVAVQMLTWGFAQPIAGAIADRSGTGRVLVLGTICAGIGFALRGIVETPVLFILTGLLVGVGTGSASFPIVLGALGKIVAPARRSFIMGLGTASASFGMFAGAPLAAGLISWLGWQTALICIGLAYALILPVIPLIARVSKPTAQSATGKQFSAALSIAFSDRSYLLLFFGFFVCGFHVAFIQTHLPAYISDLGFATSLAGWSLALIGLFNVAGSFGAGWSGQIYSKKNVLSGIYAARAAVITGFILIPASPTTILVFSALMGLLWLSTVPLTMGLVAQTQGLTYLSTLSGLVFLSHQVGSFTGAWMGGRIYDLAQDYTPMWWAAVALGLMATLLHLPIRETPGKLAQLDAR